MNMDCYVTNIESTVELFKLRFYNMKNPNREKDYVMFMVFIVEEQGYLPDKIGLGRLLTHIFVAMKEMETDHNKLVTNLITTLNVMKQIGACCLIHEHHFDKIFEQDCIMILRNFKYRKSNHYDDDDGGFC